MKIAVKLFARARDIAGADRVEVETAEPATVGALRAGLRVACPGLAPLVPHLLMAVNAEYAGDATVIRATDEVACFPPVSGG